MSLPDLEKLRAGAAPALQRLWNVIEPAHRPRASVQRLRLIVTDEQAEEMVMAFVALADLLHVDATEIRPLVAEAEAAERAVGAQVAGALAKGIRKARKGGAS